MHAMMSDRTSRQLATMHGPDPGFTMNCASYVAESEARRILAVTEPHVLCGAPLTEATAHGSRGPWNFYYGGRDYRTSAGGDWSAEAGALAESLASFLAAPDPAAYLAAQVAR